MNAQNEKGSRLEQFCEANCMKKCSEHLRAEQCDGRASVSPHNEWRHLAARLLTNESN